MKKLIVLLSGLMAAVSMLAAPRYNIVPTPKKLVEAPGEFQLSKSTRLVVEEAAFKEFADDFKAQVKLATGFSLEGKGNAIRLVKRDGLGKEAYRLVVSPESVTIEATEYNGAYYGLQTLLQLLPAEIYSPVKAKGVKKWTAPCCTIDDEPEFWYRGFLFDSGRFFFPKEELMKFIDLMGMYKQNMFHWHLTEDQGWRIQIDKYPRLTEVGAWRKETAWHSGIGNGIPHGGFYTKDDIREVVEYARKRCVTVIPEVEIPGHCTAAITAYPELSCFPDRHYEVETRWGIWKNLYAPTAKTFTFLEDVFTELFELFPSPIYHIGGDEAPKVRWEQCPRCQQRIRELGLTSDGTQKAEAKLQGYFTKRVEAFLNKHGRKLIGWDELMESDVNETATIMSWRGVKGGLEASRKGHDVIMAPTSHCYFDYYQTVDHEWEEPFSFANVITVETTYGLDPAPDTLTPEAQKHILGAQANLWTEYIAHESQAFYQVLPRMGALSEVQWVMPAQKDFRQFVERERRLTLLYKVYGWPFAGHIFK